MTMALFVWSACLGVLLALVIENIIDRYNKWKNLRHYDGGCQHSPIKCYFCHNLETKEKTNANSHS
jgi:hypothetical protein